MNDINDINDINVLNDIDHLTKVNFDSEIERYNNQNIEGRH